MGTRCTPQMMAAIGELRDRLIPPGQVPRDYKVIFSSDEIMNVFETQPREIELRYGRDYTHYELSEIDFGGDKFDAWFNRIDLCDHVALVLVTYEGSVITHRPTYATVEVEYGPWEWKHRKGLTLSDAEANWLDRDIYDSTDPDAIQNTETTEVPFRQVANLEVGNTHRKNTKTMRVLNIALDPNGDIMDVATHTPYLTVAEAHKIHTIIARAQALGASLPIGNGLELCAGFYAEMGVTHWRPRLSRHWPWHTSSTLALSSWPIT
jgi:hypothetical protein